METNPCTNTKSASCGTIIAPLVVSSRFLGDFHAIRRAQAMAEEDEGLEVWRGMKCIYRRDALPSDLLPDDGHRVPNLGADRAGGIHTD